MKSRLRRYLISLAAALMFVGCILPAGCAEQAPKAPTPAEVRVAADASASLLMQRLAEAYMAKHEGARVAVEFAPEDEALARCASGEADAAAITRELRDDERQGEALQLCAQGISVIVHADNPVGNLSMADVRAVFGSAKTDWREVGGEAGEIALFRGSFNAGISRAFQQAVGADFGGHQNLAFCTVDDPACSALSINPGGISYTLLGEADKFEDVKAVSVGGTAPTRENVASGTYPLAMPLLLLACEPQAPETAAFIAFCQSDDDALRIIEMAGWARTR